ncbi:MAG: hypothetical protein ACQEXB_04960 [Bacillota bacterium]
MSDKEKVLKSDGSEMDEIVSQPVKMVGLFIGLTAFAFGYVYLWSFLLSN